MALTSLVIAKAGLNRSYLNAVPVASCASV